MASVESKSMDSPDETRSPEKTRMSVVYLGRAAVARLQAEPGWRWSECIKPVVGGESCQAAHLGYVVSGRLHIASTDGSELDLGPGDAYRIDPGMTHGCSATSRSWRSNSRARPLGPTPRAERTT